jgi:hypothetical protein
MIDRRQESRRGFRADRFLRFLVIPAVVVFPGCAAVDPDDSM